jgi:hypothetical protein
MTYHPVIAQNSIAANCPSKRKTFQLKPESAGTSDCQSRRDGRTGTIIAKKLPMVLWMVIAYFALSFVVSLTAGKLIGIGKGQE